MAHADSPDLDSLSVLDDAGHRKYVQPADVRGRFRTAKPYVYWLLIALYAALPWLEFGGHPAVLIDIPLRRFYLFGKIFNAQDFYLAFFFLTGIGFGLIVISALWGRIWCGWACPQTVFLDGVFRRVERWIEGPHHARIRLAKAPWTASKVRKRVLKHTIYLALSFAIAHIFISYFVPLPRLFEMMRTDPAENWEAFAWAFAITALVYGNFWWFREQLCIVICPYGRLQSVLGDRDTLIIGYDAGRGEPRGKAKDPSAGDCVDCHGCVAVCPTGIDIRNGLQLECVGCAYCIDACDEIMDKLDRPAGLIRYDSQRGLSEGRRRFWRGRVFFYLAAGLAGVAVATVTWMNHLTFEADMLRMQGPPYVLIPGTVGTGDAPGADGSVQNQLQVHVVNKNAVATTITIAVEPPVPLASAGSAGAAEVLITNRSVDLEPFAGHKVPVIVSVPQSAWRRGEVVRLRVSDSVSGESKVIEASLLGPRDSAGGLP